MASRYFLNLFRTSNPHSFEEFFEEFIPKVTESMNMDLIKEVTLEEIKIAVFSINSEKAPGHDGMTCFFYKKFWEVIKSQWLIDVKMFFQSGKIQAEWNHTHITLILKITAPKVMSDLRPISLCTVLYKIFSKIMVNRLKVHLPLIVSPTQSAFVSDRLISDNILIAHEIAHSLKTIPAFSEEFMTVKSDMSKAYDRVEWVF